MQSLSVTKSSENVNLHQSGSTGMRALLALRDPGFFPALAVATQSATSFAELLPLSNLRKRAARDGFFPNGTRKVLRMAIAGGYTLEPLSTLVEHFIEAAYGFNVECRMFQGDFDAYTSEILNPESDLYKCKPDLVYLAPSERHCTYLGPLTDPSERAEVEARANAQDLLKLCSILHERTKAEVFLNNFPLPACYDPGRLRGRTYASPWSFRKLVNLELGLSAPPFVHICDVEFMANRRGALQCSDPRGWFESKQPFSSDFLVDVAREVGFIQSSLRGNSKKVLILDLDNTLWGGVIGDDGLDGIELGGTSPRGEAFRAFQSAARSLKERGVLLAVCSKNDHDRAVEPFEKHPEMALRLDDFVAFKANWNPKSDNIREIAAELNLGFDSFVFADDNPAEIEIVRSFVPEAATLPLGEDPSLFVDLLRDSRFFEPVSLTSEDAQRTQQYHEERKRQQVFSTCTDMGSYLTSLEMKGRISPFQAPDIPRIAQLINKSNQFNLTTVRRTEAEIAALLDDPGYSTFTVRLSDKFGDNGLIAAVILRHGESDLYVDTWLMSCRVLKRQVEEETVNHMMRIAQGKKYSAIRGLYRATAKNNMVRELYREMGFLPLREEASEGEYLLDATSWQWKPTKIKMDWELS